MPKAAKVVYKPVGLVVGMVGGTLAGLVFRKIWDRVGPGQDAPEPLEQDHGWGEVLAAAAIQGLIFAVVRAAVQRGGAAGWRRVTGTWPGD
ncbi:DUF4235 domain-containing protein [Streptomyces sp. H39-S7]|uniref:DUF4235 domain-containing protein n=1 Tax=Streptomyces sp. H39-S7 TaxID=3004357 RepID=UPI0022AE860A|nr:DUF4235 domain-containing protein [Streptomyces sp. H39-S7]MCZ4120946.1 DUF4235 domain-containing protein [Streptomyces sp. H39-S7]